MEKDIGKIRHEQNGSNKFRAAEVLQVSYKTLLTKIKDYQLEKKGGEREHQPTDTSDVRRKDT